jgi:hypothetical protein
VTTSVWMSYTSRSFSVIRRDQTGGIGLVDPDLGANTSVSYRSVIFHLSAPEARRAHLPRSVTIGSLRGGSLLEELLTPKTGNFVIVNTTAPVWQDGPHNARPRRRYVTWRSVP